MPQMVLNASCSNCKLTQNNFQEAFNYLTSGLVSLTKERFSEHQNSVVQISYCNRLIMM